MMQPPPPPPPPSQTMELTAASAAAQQQHELMMLDLQAQRLASSLDVPTLPDQVRTALREIGCPVRLFGENLANVRDRLRLELAKRQVYAEKFGLTGPVLPDGLASSSSAPAVEAVEETKYTRATPELIKAREKIASFSLQKSRERLERERLVRQAYKSLQKKRKAIAEDENVDTTNVALAEEMDKDCCKMYQQLKQATLAGSQYGDVRALSAIATTYHTPSKQPRVLTASWNATLQWWDGSSPTLDQLGRKRQTHEDRVMGVALQSSTNNNNSNQNLLAGTASIDLTAKLWKIVEKEDTDMPDASTVQDEEEAAMKYAFEEVAHLKGHAARLCKIAFHPIGDLVATTSHDHTWRLWDIESASEILLQDGHAAEVFGVDFHPDGSLAATTDYSGMIHLWDLRSGKTAMQYWGHAGRVLSAQFAPINGFSITSAGDDGCLKIWDLRHRRKAKGGAPEPRRTIPAHSRLITQLQYTSDDECLVTSSFDGTAKIWSTRGDWKLLQTLEGHEGKVSGVGVVATYDDQVSKEDTAACKAKDWGIVTCGFDKTLKLWS